MAVTRKQQHSSSHSPPNGKKGRPPIKKEKMFRKKGSRSGRQGTLVVSCNEPRNSKCEKRKRSSYDDLYDNEEVKIAVMDQAKEIQANLAPEFPSFIKFMLHSHVTGGFWLVYIARSKGLDEVDCALGLLKLDTCNRQLDSEKHISMCEEVDDRYWEPLAQDIPQENFQKDNHLICTGTSLELGSKQSEDESKDLGSEVLNGLKFCESVVDFKDLKSIEDFSIVVNDLIIDSALSKHLRAKYHELCCSQKSFLHDSLLNGLNCRLISGMISETINIADAIRASKSTTPPVNFDIWDKTLKAFKMMGMNVGFLLTRLDQLMNLASKFKRFQEARVEREKAEEEKRALELKLLEVRDRIDKYVSEIESLDMDADGLDFMFQEMARAPW